MADNIGALAIGTVQHLDDHGFPSVVLVILSGYEGSRSTGLKHLLRFLGFSYPNFAENGAWRHLTVISAPRTATAPSSYNLSENTFSWESLLLLAFSDRGVLTVGFRFCAAANSYCTMRGEVS